MQLHRAFSSSATGRRRGEAFPGARGRAGLVFVGNGSRRSAHAFRDELGIEAPVFVDSGRKAYAALGMRRGVGATIGSLAAVRNSARALRAGFRQRGVQGDPWQLGGVLVVRPGGEIVYRYLSRVAGDHPEPEQVLEAAAAALSLDRSSARSTERAILD